MADEMEKPDLSKFAIKGITTTQSAGYRSIYVNSSRMGVSPWDVRLTVGQVVELGAGQVNQDEATLIMSPQHAKQFLRSLEKTIGSYEEVFGPIADLTAAIESAKDAAAINAKPKPKRKKT